jgi:hypothetical protein
MLILDAVLFFVGISGFAALCFDMVFRGVFFKKSLGENEKGHFWDVHSEKTFWTFWFWIL